MRINIVIIFGLLSILLPFSSYGKRAWGHDILLIINYNHPHYESIPFLKKLYAPYFPQVIFVGPKNHPHVEYCDHDRGYYAYKSLAEIVHKHPNYAGYLWINDDCVINPWNFFTFDKTRIWTLPSIITKLDPSERQGWGWWPQPIGYKAILNSYNKMSDKHKKMLAKNCGDHAVFTGAAEVVYLPAQYRSDIIELCTILAQERSFVEIAFPTICGCLDEKKNWHILEGLWLYDQQNPIARYTKKLDYLHPLKFSQKNNQLYISKQFNI